MKKVLTIGGAVHDIFIQYKDAERNIFEQRSYLMLEEGKKMEVTALSHFSGGGATNCAVSFKRLGFQATAFFKVGADEAGEFVINDVRSQGVNADYAITSEQASTGVSFILQSPSGNHPILVDRAINLTLSAPELPLDLVHTFDQLYVTSLSENTAKLLPLIAQATHKAGVPLATNPGTNQLQGDAHSLRAALPFIDTLILNAREARIFMKALADIKPTSSLQKKMPESSPKLFKEFMTLDGIHYSLHDYFAIVLSLGARVVVVTNGAEGVYVATKDTIFFHPSIKTDVVSSVGAGDAFASCFVAVLAQGKDIATAIRSGVLNSSSVLNYIGAKTGLLTSEELQDRLDTLSANLLQKHSFSL